MTVIIILNAVLIMAAAVFAGAALNEARSAKDLLFVGWLLAVILAFALNTAVLVTK